MNLNDAINAAIPDIAGAQNHINDKLLRYYKANGATSNDLRDAELQFLVARGVPAGHLADMWEQYLRVTKGYGAGHINDLKLRFWEEGGTTGIIAAFSGTPVFGVAPLSVTFTDESAGGPTSWSWEKNNGSGWVPFDGTPAAQNPVENFAAGSWSVRLTVSNVSGSDDETKAGYVSAGSAPVAAFSGTPLSGAPPLAVTFTDASTNSPTSWSWEKNDGGGWVPFAGTPAAQNPVENFAAGTWSVRLTATNAFGSDDETKAGYVTSASFIVATGGTITTDGDYKVHTFNASGTFQVTSGSGNVQYLVVAGGGGGSQLGGGGAGGYLTNGAYDYAVSVNSYTVTVGAGGGGGSGSSQGGDGGNSVFATITATGGGGGGAVSNTNRHGRNGGSGGGSGTESGGVYAPGTPGTGIVGQGKNGGSAGATGGNAGGGGGGANAVGGNGNGGAPPTGGNGGSGLASSITGSSVTRAGGGGGGGASVRGTGGAGGGGQGNQGGSAGSAGTANTGGGGGGGYWSTGFAGGSGVVIVRYKFQ